MFKVTEAAAAQIRLAAKQGGTEGMCLRLAAQQNQDGTIDYLMGFDEPADEDLRVISEGIEILMVPETVPLLDEAVMDYVELNDEEFRFIFSNPKDANWSPPTEQ